MLFANKIKFLKIGFDLVPSSQAQPSMQFLEMVQILLKEDKNLQLLRRHIGFSSILALFRMIEQNDHFLSLYDITLTLFELFISALCRSQITVPTQEERSELALIFEFLLSRDLERRLKFIKSSQQVHVTQGLNSASDVSFQNLLLSCERQSELVSRVIIDCLSIISIHILNETSEPEAKAKSVLLSKISKSIDLSNFIFSLLQV